MLLIVLLSLSVSFSYATAQSDNSTAIGPVAAKPPPALSPAHSIQAYQKRSAEHLLYAYFFKGGRYRRSVRPVLDHTHSIRVRVGVCIMTIDDIVEKDQSMITSGAVKMKWNDEFLTWHPEEFHNLSWLALPSSDIWLPDIAMVNSPDPYQITRKLAYAEISNNGDVGYYPSGRFSTRCHITLTYFPFDWQECDLIFESWVYPNLWLSIEPWYPDPIDMKDYYRNHQWDLNRYAVTTGNVTYDGLDFSFIRFRFYFRRKILYYAVLVIFPCTLMSLLQILSHTLAVEHPARATVLTSLFVSSTFLQGSLASQMPKSSEGVTLIQTYLMIMSLNLIISLLVTFMNMHVWFRVPPWPFPTLPHMLHAYLLDVGTTPASHVNPPLLPAALLKVLEARRQRQEQERKAMENLEKKLERIRLKREERARNRREFRALQARLAAEAATAPPVSESICLRVKKISSAGDLARGDSNFKLFEKERAIFVNEETQRDSKLQDDFPSEPDDVTKPLLQQDEPPDVEKGLVKVKEEIQLKCQPVETRRKSGPPFSLNELQKHLSTIKKLEDENDDYDDDDDDDLDDEELGKEQEEEKKEEPAEPPPPPPAPPTLAERKERWLQFSRVLDKVFLVFMITCNFLSPVIIFGIVPLFQEYYYDYDEGNVEYFVIM